MLTTDRIAGGALCGLALYVVWESRRLPLGTWRAPGPAYMPLLLAGLLLLLGALVLASGGRAPGIHTVGWSEAPQAVLILLAAGAAVASLERLGYRLAISGLLFALLRLVERKSTGMAVAVALGLGLGSFYLFDTLLRVPLPRGPFGL